MRQAAALRNYRPAVALPNIRMNTSADSYLPIRQMRLVQFDGRSWQPFGAVIETAFTEGASSSELRARGAYDVTHTDFAVVSRRAFASSPRRCEGNGSRRSRSDMEHDAK